MYHIELRQFPHNACHFNLTDAQLRAIVEPWAQERQVELGERKWSPHQARLTIFEGREIALSELSMGRGWGIVQRDCADVTERVMAAARAGTTVPPAAASPAAAPVAPAPSAPGGGEGSPVVQQPAPVAAELEPALVALLGEDGRALLEAWSHASALYRNRSPSERLALAEEALRSSGER